MRSFSSVSLRHERFEIFEVAALRCFESDRNEANFCCQRRERLGKLYEVVSKVMAVCNGCVHHSATCTQHRELPRELFPDVAMQSRSKFLVVGVAIFRLHSDLDI